MDKAERLASNYNQIGDLVYITPEDLLVVELNASLLDLAELFEMLFIEQEHLSEHELSVITRVHAKGKRKAIADAATHLFQRMKGNNGTDACIEFLKTAGKFTIEGTPAPGTGQGGFAFNVFMPGETNEV